MKLKNRKHKKYLKPKTHFLKLKKHEMSKLNLPNFETENAYILTRVVTVSEADALQITVIIKPSNTFFFIV